MRQVQVLHLRQDQPLQPAELESATVQGDLLRLSIRDSERERPVFIRARYVDGRLVVGNGANASAWRRLE